MTHTAALTVAQGVLLYIAMLWKLTQLAQAPWDVPLRWVTICLLCAGAAYPFGVAAGHVALTQLSAGPMLFMWAQEVFLLGLVYALVCVFLFSGLDSTRARAQALRQALPLIATLTALTLVALAAPSGVAPAEYPISVVSMFFLVADVYVVYGLVVVFRWTREYGRGAGQRLARGLMVTSLGLAAMAMATLLLIVAVITRWASGHVPVILTTATILLLLPGILLFIGGVSYPGIAMRLAALPIWFEHRTAYRRMAPLWTELHAAFPEDALVRVPLSPWRDALTLRAVHRRYYRRVIECRDGLVRLSPYLGHLRGTSAFDTSVVADHLRQALRARAANEQAPSRAVPIAIPTSAGIDADVRELVALSRALHTT